MTREEFKDKKSKDYRKYREACGIKDPVYLDEIEDAYYQGMVDADAHMWKDAQGDDLPDYDREVVVLVQHVPEYHDSLRVSFGHRPDPKGYVVVNGEKLYARTFGKGWSLPNVRYWLDARLPYEKEEINGNLGKISPNRIIGTEEHIRTALDFIEKGGEQWLKKKDTNTITTKVTMLVMLKVMSML